MKIWCCLCFTEDDEKEDRLLVSAMKEDSIFVNVGDPEGTVGGVDEDPEEATRLGLALDRPHDRNRHHRGGDSRNRDESDPLGLFEEMILAMNGGANWEKTAHVGAVTPAWMRLVGCSRRAEGESTSASAATVDGSIEDSDHDLHHKRAKVYSGLQ